MRRLRVGWAWVPVVALVGMLGALGVVGSGRRAGG